MRAIVTTNAEILEKDYEGYIKVTTIGALASADVTEIVLNTFTDNHLEASLRISELQKRGIRKIVYVAEEFIPGVQIAVNGLGGYCTRDMFYFDDVEELNMLFEDYMLANTEELAIKGNLQIIEQFIQTYVQSGDAISPFYVTRAENALRQLREDMDSKIAEVKTVGSTALEVFRSANAYLSDVSKKAKLLQEQLSSMEQTKNSPRAMMGNSAGAVAYFPTVNLAPSVFNTTKVLYIREYAPCRYLTSLMIAYKYYLQYSKNKRVKLVIAIQRGQGTAMKYDFATMITLESCRDNTLFGNDILAINVPQKTNIEKIFGKEGKNNDIVIFIDRLYGGSAIINSNSPHFHKLYAVSGNSDFKRYNIPPQKSIMSQVGNGKEFIKIPHIKSYPQDLERRLSTYQQICTNRKKDENGTDIFVKLDSLLEIRG